MVKYTGSSNWQQVERPVWSVDHWGVDRARVLWRGRATAKDAFEKSLKPWSVMPDFNTMKQEGWTSSIITPSYPGVEITYIGFRSGVVPSVKVTDSVSTQQATVSGTDPDTSVSFSGPVVYKASRTTYQWFEKTEPPPIPRYRTVRKKVDPELVLQNAIPEDNALGASAINDALKAILKAMPKEEVVSDYDCEMIVPNQLWACRSSIDYRLKG